MQTNWVEVCAQPNAGQGRTEELMKCMKERMRNSRREQKEYLVRETMEQLFMSKGLGKLAEEYGVDALMSGV